MYDLKGGWREWERSEFPYDEKESELPEIVQGCVNCHEQVTPFVVSEWQRSKHSTNMVLIEGWIAMCGVSPADFTAVMQEVADGDHV